MGMIIYQHDQYYIQEVHSRKQKGFILANRNKEFSEGHSHFNNFKAAKYVLFLATKEKIPNDLDTYRMTSLYRILEDSPFREKVLELIQRKESKSRNVCVNIAVKESKNKKIS